MNKILLIGCGHMGSALLTSWHKNTNNYFTIVDPYQYKTINKKFRKRCDSYKDIGSSTLSLTENGTFLFEP